MKHTHIETNRITLHVVELGEGPAVIFCHGFPDTWRSWRRQMEAVAAAGFRAIALDMRGYGESSAPESADQYTTLHSVGDLVGLLDALEISTATLVGHDFGANIVWNAALMRPDRFAAVLGISVAFTPRGDKSVLEQFADAGHTDFYMFERGQPEADARWANAAVMLPANLYWSSAAAPREERWTMFNRSLPKYQSLPGPLPDWADLDDLRDEIADFTRTGFHTALNYYRALQLSFDLLAPFKGQLVTQPSFFLGGAEDALVTLGGPKTPAALRKVLPGLVDSLVLPDIGHWPQLEASKETSDAIVGFLKHIHSDAAS
jgi:pimeloyl-ACP methyl ester carboxylesterase